MSDNTDLKDAYQNMQRNYVFSEKDLLSFEFVTNQWKKLQRALNDMEKFIWHIWNYEIQTNFTYTQIKDKYHYDVFL